MEFIVVKIGIFGMSKEISKKYIKSIKKAFKKVDVDFVYLQIPDQTGVVVERFETSY